MWLLYAYENPYYLHALLSIEYDFYASCQGILKVLEKNVAI